MKKVFASILVLAAAMTSYTAHATIAPAAFQTEQTAKAVELPAAVKTTLAKDYEGWSVSSVAEDKGVYTVQLKKGDETKTVKLDKDGKKAE